jgi:hypothetical protein
LLGFVLAVFTKGAAIFTFRLGKQHQGIMLTRKRLGELDDTAEGG